MKHIGIKHQRENKQNSDNKIVFHNSIHFLFQKITTFVIRLYKVKHEEKD